VPFPLATRLPENMGFSAAWPPAVGSRTLRVYTETGW
jgi:hypothetical protein